MRVEVATEAAVRTVFERMDPRHREELAVVGLTVTEAERLALDWMRGEEALVMMLDEEPVYAGGLVRQDGRLWTWFVATPEYYAAGLKAVLSSRREMRKIVRRRGPVYTRSFSAHPLAEQWFEALGFRAVEGDERSVTYRMG